MGTQLDGRGSRCRGLVSHIAFHKGGMPTSMMWPLVGGAAVHTQLPVIKTRGRLAVDPSTMTGPANGEHPVACPRRTTGMLARETTGIVTSDPRPLVSEFRTLAWRTPPLRCRTGCRVPRRLSRRRVPAPGRTRPQSSDSQLGTVVRANRHLSGHADARVPCLARPGPCDRFDVPGPLPAWLEGPSAQREGPQSDDVEVAIRLELPGLVRDVDVTSLKLSNDRSPSEVLELRLVLIRPQIPS